MNNLYDVLKRIAELQADTASVSLTIGGVTKGGTVRHDVVMVSSAPPKIVSMLVSEFRFVAVRPEGLEIVGKWL